MKEEFNPEITINENNSENNGWGLFFETSPLRSGLISWYEFTFEDRVYEIEPGKGALTGRLCEKCGSVVAKVETQEQNEFLEERFRNSKNLELIFSEEEMNLKNQSFDYIIYIGGLEKLSQDQNPWDRKAFSDKLIGYRRLLKENGKLLIGVDNRYGLKYLCGAPDPYTNRAFDGMNRNPSGGNGHLFSKSELDEILSFAGFSNKKFYYPLPDYKFPQLIYSDAYLPEKNLKERLVPYYTRNDTLIAYENEIYDDVIENGVFPFVANSFFVEAALSNKAEFCDVLYAAVSTDRGKERALITSINERKSVKKYPIFQEGRESLQQLFDNMKELEKRGIPVIKNVLKEEKMSLTLEMPYIEWPTLSNYIKEIIIDKPEKVVEIIDQLYNYILKSSEEVETDSRKEMLGPILKKAYIELIPLNCFYNDETDQGKGEFIFFDQEFARENCPAKYVLFRAIHYIYCFTPNAESYLPIDELKERYNLVKVWDLFLEEELAFLAKIKNYKEYEQYYNKTKIDWKRIIDNADRLTSEEERIANYKISSSVKKIWNVELDILHTVDLICKKYNIKYFALHGTLLGAVRHKGFIPWDDDLDIGMLRNDYDRFLELTKDKLTDPLSLELPENNMNMFWGGFARIRNRNTTAIETRELGHIGNHGIWIDILPIDSVPENEKLFHKKQSKIRRFQRLMYAKIYGKEFKQFFDMSPKIWNVYRMLGKFCSHKSLCKKLNLTMKLYSDIESPYVSELSGYFNQRILNKKDFENVINIEFSGKTLPVPEGYENYLFATMGRDYLKYPPEEERKPKHAGIFDPDKAYSFYEKKLCDIFSDVKGKEIILFGAGIMFEDYMKKYGNKYKPSFVVDNDQNKWGRYRMGIEIKSPKELYKVSAGKRKLIICSFYYKEIEKQLKEMNILEYNVYVKETDWVVSAEKVN